MDEEALFNVPKLSHEPINPPREGLIGENMFYSEWQKLMAKESPSMFDSYFNWMLASILSPMKDVLKQRHATVAASFITWLGRNNGQGFLHGADMLAKSGAFIGGSEDAYLAAWAIDNRRISNGGMRTIDHVLTPWSLPNQADQHKNHLPKLSREDYEVIEHVVIWLGGEEGQDFLTGCRKRVSEALDAMRRKNAAECKVVEAQRAVAAAERECLRLGLTAVSM